MTFNPAIMARAVIVPVGPAFGQTTGKDIRSFQIQMDSKIFNLIFKFIIVAPKTFKRFRFFI